MNAIELHIALSSWIIQDGNYGDFIAGETHKFGLEFYPEKIMLSKNSDISFAHLDGTRYEINSRIIFLDDRCVVLDFGVKAYFEFHNAKFDFKLGDFVTGIIHIGIDPFMYFEGLNKKPGMPELIYSWIVKEIHIETAPFIENISDAGTKTLVRDPSKSKHKKIQQTDAWTEDNGLGEYILICDLSDSTTYRYK